MHVICCCTTCQGYKKAGELQNILKTIKWGSDYLIKCDLGGTAAVGQVP